MITEFAWKKRICRSRRGGRSADSRCQCGIRDGLRSRRSTGDPAIQAEAAIVGDEQGHGLPAYLRLFF